MAWLNVGFAGAVVCDRVKKGNVIMGVFGRQRGMCLLAALMVLCAATVDADDEFSDAVRADWAAQEARHGRTPADAAAIRDATSRFARLLDDLLQMPGAPNLRQETALLARLRSKEADLDRLDPSTREALYREIRTAARQAALKNPLLAARPILFLKQRRFICQMLHEYLGYYYNYGDLAGGDVCVLEEPGRSFKVRALTERQMPRGAYTTLSLSYDAKTAYFAFAEVRDAERPRGRISDWTRLQPAQEVGETLNYFSPSRSCFHLFAIDVDGSKLRQLTHGKDDDFDPCPLPDGGIGFMSTRRGGFGRCHNLWEPLPTYTLYRIDPAGKRVERLSSHETNEWHPSVLNDGRIVYSRWDYVDRSAANYHGLWATNPDGTNPAILFGNYTQRINACYQPRAIPDSNRIAFIAGAHHAPVGGALAIFDPARAALDPDSGQDRFEAIESLTPEVGFPEAPGWPRCYFHSPWPLSENYFLIAFGDGPLPGLGPKVTAETPTGLYYFDRFGNMELLYRESGISCTHPIPLAARPVPPVLPRVCDPQLANEGEFVLANVSWSLMPLPGDRPIRSIRIFEALSKTFTHVANHPRIGYANAEFARMLLGTVPVEADGSAYFRVPADKPLYFQAVDENGRAVQTMRSITYLRPGERRSCVGCHEPRASTPPPQPLLALRREPSSIEPGPDGTRPFSFPRLVQPVLDRYCVRCHDGTQGEGKHAPDLRGQPAGHFTTSYAQLQPYVRWYEWGDKTIEPIITRPGRGGADESPLTRILDDPTHRNEVSCVKEDRQRIELWLDSNAPFYGTYESDQQQAQRFGLPAIDVDRN